MSPPSPRQIEAAMSAAMQLRAELGEDDAQLVADTLEGETQVFEVMDRLAESAIRDELLVATAQARAQRLQQRAQRIRATLQQMMDALALSKLERPLYTASLAYRRHAIVTGNVPADYLRTAPDMRRVAKDLLAGEKVAGAVLSNPQPSITLRTK